MAGPQKGHRHTRAHRARSEDCHAHRGLEGTLEKPGSDTIGARLALLRLDRWHQWTRFLLPAVFPGLVTGWVTAAGGAWNATIVSEYVQAGGKLYQATGLGALISRATDAGNFPKLTAAVLIMAVVVVGINRTLWKKLQVLADNRCRFGL